MRNFLDWLEAGFGKALTKSFMAPYNAKVWAHPPDEMNLIWVGERVATIKFSDILRNVINRQDVDLGHRHDAPEAVLPEQRTQFDRIY